MNKKYVVFLMTILLIFVGCSEEVVKIDQPIEGSLTRTIKVKASVGGDEIGSRVAIEQDGFDVKLTWEPNDVIWFVFSDGVNHVHASTTLTEVSNNGRRAEFEIEVPAGSNAETFDLYGYYGGGPLTGDLGTPNSGDLGIVNLPAITWGGPLPALEDADLVMLRFEALDLDMDSPEISVTFHHVGSLFKIFLENTSNTTYEDVTSVEIYSENENELIYAHQYDGNSGNVLYDVVNDAFVEGNTFTNKLSFITAGGNDSFSPGEVLELWGWFPPSQDVGHNWPALKLRFNYNNGVDLMETNNSTEPKSETTAIGRAYHFYAYCDGTSLSFSNVYKQKMIDNRERSQYNVIGIGNQTWMAENLRFYSENDTISNPFNGSDIDQHYYVYGFSTDLGDAEALQSFRLGGILYNWAAALNGDTGSSSNPSGVRGICPEGWHLPSQAEWQNLINYAGTGPGAKLKDRLRWEEDGSTVDTNEYGFTARPGGIRNNTTPYYSGLGADGYWFVSDIVSSGTEMRVASISHDQSDVTFIDVPKDYAVSVRCVKD